MHLQASMHTTLCGNPELAEHATLHAIRACMRVQVTNTAQQPQQEQRLAHVQSTRVRMHAYIEGPVTLTCM